MRPPIKDHTSIGLDNPTIDASDGATVELDEYNITENKDTARQEHGKEADINYMLSRFGIVPERGAPLYGEWDDTLDLQQALDSTREAKRAYQQLPDNLKKQFTSMEELLEAVNNGSLVIKNEPAPVPDESKPA